MQRKCLIMYNAKKIWFSIDDKYMNKQQLLFQLFSHLEKIMNSVQLIELQVIRGKEKLYTVIWG